jgi:aminoglycoside phosphotransferase (APT) family kinase protein
MIPELVGQCRRAFRTWSDLEVCGLRRISDGWECDLFSFDLLGEEAGEQRRRALILRVYPGREAAQKATKEFHALRQLYRAEYPVPEVLLLQAEGTPLGQPFIIMERIDGPVLGEVIRRSPAGRQGDLLTLFCQIFVDLHALDWRPFVAGPQLHQVEGTVGRWLATREPMVQQLGRSEFDPVMAWLRERGPGIRCRALSLTHGDYHTYNVLLRPDGAPCVIDWTGAEVSDYRFDLAWTLLLMSAIGGSGMRDAILGEYERLTGSQVEEIEFFDVVASTRRLFSILVSITGGAERLGMRPGAEALMKKSRHHVAAAYALLRSRTGLQIPAVEDLLTLLG